MNKIKYLITAVTGLAFLACSDVATPPSNSSVPDESAIGRLIVPEYGEEIETSGKAFNLSKSSTPYAVLFDQGPSTGEIGGCWASWSHTWNLADQFSFNETTVIHAVRIFTCVSPAPGIDVHVKIMGDDNDIPDAFLYEEFKAPESWVANPDDIGYAVTVALSTPFQAEANTKYWASISGDYYGLGQYSVFSPTDGILAAFRGRTYLGKTSQVGDMCFQLLADVTPPEIFMTLETEQLWPANHKLIRVAKNVYAVDDHSDATLHISVSSNESIYGPGDRNTDADWNIVINEDGSYDIYLRAERSGNGSGRIYTITADAVDGAGNASQVLATVSVPKSQKK